MSEADAPSVRLVYPEDCVRISDTCGACVCLLVLKGCEHCKRFWPAWSDFCAAVKDGEVLTVHCEVSHHRRRADDLLGASANPSAHATYPAVLVCTEGVAATLDVDSACGAEELQLKVMHTLGQGVARAPYEDERTPLEELDMEEEAWDEATDEPDEPPVVLDAAPDEVGGCGRKADCGCSASAASRSTSTADEVAVTHDVPPAEALALAEAASADERVAVLYFTNWCGHCKHFKPVWNACVGKGGSHKWVAVNCESDAGSAAAAAQGVRGYPTVHLHHRYKEPYKGERSVEALLDFVHRGAVTPALLTYKMRSNKDVPARTSYRGETRSWNCRCCGESNGKTWGKEINPISGHVTQGWVIDQPCTRCGHTYGWLCFTRRK